MSDEIDEIEKKLNKPVADIFSLGDVSSLNQVHEMTIMHPDSPITPLTNNGKPVIWKYVGAESDAFQSANHANRKIINSRATAGLEFDPGVEDDGIIRALAYCSMGWEGVPKSWVTGKREDTQMLDFDTDTAFKVLKRLPWLRRQVSQGVWKHEPFGKAS